MSENKVINANKIVIADNIVVAFVSDTLALAPNYQQIVDQLPAYYQQHINHFADANYRLQSALCFMLLNELCQQNFVDKNAETYIPLAQNCETNFSCDQEKTSQSYKENNLFVIKKFCLLNKENNHSCDKENNQSFDQENSNSNEQKKPLRCDGMTNNQFVDIQFSANGKPFDPSGKIFFSFSHTPSLAVCAIAPFDIGMDATERIPFDRATARIICSPAEFAELEKQGEPCRNDDTLAQLITRKESLEELHDDDDTLAQLITRKESPVKLRDDDTLAQLITRKESPVKLRDDNTLAQLITRKESLVKLRDDDDTLAQLITRKESLLKLRDGKLCQIDQQPNLNDIEYFTFSLDDDHICTVCAHKQRAKP